MYELNVVREFCAAHALVIGGVRERTHGHNWRVTATVGGPELDDDGLLCDFHELERRLDEIIGPWDGGDLNEQPPFDRVNPSAELVARTIGERLAAALPHGVAVVSVEVTEAPGCSAVFRP
jgi:6-pyruvoyltetrahydropterin/6-carboxytetrahydropterin synthase